jgi:polar amino acid transport system permease protein
MSYSFQFSVVWDNLGVLLAGAWLTVKISLISIALCLVIGIIGALFRTSENRFLDWIALAYVEVIRNTPYLIQLFFIFFGLPNLGLKPTAEQAAIASLAVNFRAYCTEIV